MISVKKVRTKALGIRSLFKWSLRFWITVRINVLHHVKRDLMGIVAVLLVVVEEVVVEVLVLVVQMRPDEPSNISSLSAVEVNHAPQSDCAKDDALKNIFSMLFTLDTSQLEMSPLNDDAKANIDFMLVTLDTSHLEMSPLNLFAPSTKS